MVQMGDVTIQDQAVMLPDMFDGGFSKDISVVESVGYTGIGFKPRLILYFVLLPYKHHFNNGCWLWWEWWPRWCWG